MIELAKGAALEAAKIHHAIDQAKAAALANKPLHRSIERVCGGGLPSMLTDSLSTVSLLAIEKRLTR